MTTLVVGASGATGRLLVRQLLERGEAVRIIVRSAAALSEQIINHENISVTEASLLALSDKALAKQVEGCDAITSCLGHNLSLKGIFGPPYQLVTEATKRLCKAVVSNQKHPVKFVLMNTAGNINHDLSEQVSLKEKIVLSLLRTLIPPHADNERAADFLRTQIGQNNPAIEWVAVRPDGLINESEVSEYTLWPSPTRSAIFDAGSTSRINVGHFMAELITRPELWQEWKGKMPVIYNKASENTAFE